MFKNKKVQFSKFISKVVMFTVYSEICFQSKLSILYRIKFLCRCLELQKKSKQSAPLVTGESGKKRKIQGTGCPFYKQRLINDVAREVCLMTFATIYNVYFVFNSDHSSNIFIPA